MNFWLKHDRFHIKSSSWKCAIVRVGTIFSPFFYHDRFIPFLTSKHLYIWNQKIFLRRMTFFKVWNKFSRKMFPIFSQKLVPTLAIVNCQNDVLNVWNLCYNFRKTDRLKINSGEVQIGAGVRWRLKSTSRKIRARDDLWPIKYGSRVFH